MLIAFTGNIGSGKDTASDYLVYKYGFDKTTFAKPLKDALKTLFMFSDNQLYGTQEEKNTIDQRWNLSPRKAMQWLGTDILRNQFDVNYFVKYFKLYYVDRIDTVVSDLRFLNESLLIKSLGGIVVKINRQGTTSNHQSETELHHIEYDFMIDNNQTIDDLYHQLDDLYFAVYKKNDIK
ncbi:MAG TPA: hypothetical protein VLG50_05840 [Candidatus Saccharimonadales bacterium]|nr:hypothetical protein [Candidatus Saccharimonadales bacterium]